MSARIDLINLALLKAGVATTLVSLSESTREAFTAAKLYDPTRREVLRAHEWGFATCYVSLALLDGSETEPAVARADDVPVWLYAYAYPTDPACLKARRLVGANGQRFDPNPLVWEPGRLGPTTLVIYSNEVDPMLEYTGDVEPSVTDALFEGAFTQLLASRLAATLARDGKLARDLYQLFLAELPVATTMNANERQPDHGPGDAEWIRGR